VNKIENKIFWFCFGQTKSEQNQAKIRPKSEPKLKPKSEPKSEQNQNKIWQLTKNGPK